jgi:hypothetical protein
MPLPGASVRLKKVRRRFDISGQRVVVRRHLPWYWYALVGALALVLLGVILRAVLRGGVAEGVVQERDDLRSQVRRLGDELLILRSTAGTEQNAVEMERATSQQLVGRVKALEAENSTLKEELRLFERLVRASGGEPSISIEGLMVVPEASQYFRYRTLLVFPPAKKQAEFRGRLQVVVVFSVGDKQGELIVPAGKEGAGEQLIEVRGFLRKEGRFELPVAAKIQSVEARIYQGDTLKAKRLVRL